MVDRNFSALIAIVQTTLEKLPCNCPTQQAWIKCVNFKKELFGDNNDNNNNINREKDIAPNFK